jgi:hypothetical protein
LLAVTAETGTFCQRIGTIHELIERRLSVVVQMEALRNPDWGEFLSPDRQSAARWLSEGTSPELLPALRVVLRNHDAMIRRCGCEDLVSSCWALPVWLGRWETASRIPPSLVPDERDALDELEAAAERLERLCEASGVTQQGTADEAATASCTSQPSGILSADLQRPAVFRRTGTQWEIRYSGQGGTFRDVLGFRYIHRLISAPPVKACLL